MEPLLTDTSLIRTPLYYGQFTWSLRDRNPYKAYLSKTDTSIMRTIIPVPLVSAIKRFNCILRQHILTYYSPLTATRTFKSNHLSFMPTDVSSANHWDLLVRTQLPASSNIANNFSPGSLHCGQNSATCPCITNALTHDTFYSTGETRSVTSHITWNT